MKITAIEPMKGVSFGESCCQCALSGSNVEPLVAMRANVDGAMVRFHVHLACLTQLAGAAADIHWRLITQPRAKARQRTA